MSSNLQEMFSLLSKWATLLPKGSEGKASGDLQTVESEIKKLCDMAETSATSTSLTTTKDVKSESEADFKPTFIFQLSSDDVINSEKPQFDCVYDFCAELSKYCETSEKQLDVEEDWPKLLLACSSHNYDRFMWIHLTFQASNNLKLSWKQVRKRLQSKFDDPSRRSRLAQELETKRYIPDIQSIFVHNQEFSRIADELEYDTRNYYVNSLPEKYQMVLRSTMTYDESNNFYCNLEDLQQRAVVFAKADDGKFIFYSKVAHIALSLDHEKVNKSDCEFHLLAQHSTLECPDYTIVKYPYMEFSGVPGVPDLLNSSTSSSSSTVVLDLPVMIRQPDNLAEMAVNTTTIPHIKQEVDTAIAHNPEPRVAVSTQNNNKVGTGAVDPRLSKPAPAANPQTQPKPIRTQAAVSAHPAPAAADTAAAAAANSKQKVEAHHRVAPPKAEDSRITAVSSSSSTTSHRTTTGAIPTQPKGLTRPRSPQSSAAAMSPPPKRQHLEPAFERELSPVEIGCYIHGKHSSHTTKECRQAQMVIPSRRSVSPPPPPPRSSNHERSSEKKPNICIFCKLPFKPGHLGYCKEVPRRRR